MKNLRDKIRVKEVDWSKVHPRRGSQQTVRLPKADVAWKMIAKRIEKRRSRYEEYSRRTSIMEERLAVFKKFEERPPSPLNPEGQLALAKALREPSGPRPPKGLVSFWYASEGCEFTLRMLHKSPGAAFGWTQLRRFLSVASDEVYGRALSLAEELYKTESGPKLYLAFTFPERMDWVQEMVDLWRSVRFGDDEGWVLLSCLHDDLLGDLKIDAYDDDWLIRARPYLPTLLVDQGSASIPLFETFLKHLENPSSKRACGKIMSWLESEQMADFFVGKLQDRVLKEIATSYLSALPHVALPMLARSKKAAAKALYKEMSERSEVQSKPLPVVDLPEVLSSPPSKKKLSNFVKLSALSPPKLKSGAVLPKEATKNLILLLSLSKLEAPHPGFDVVREICEPGSLSKFCWALAGQWLGANGTARNAWALQGVGHFPTPYVVNEVAKLVTRWGREKSSRVSLGLDLLQHIGTDQALMHLAHFSERGLTNKLKRLAWERLNAVAQARNLTPQQLADRTVPDLGLGQEEASVFDLGTRRFDLVFDHNLTPNLKGDGGTSARFPRARKTDDQARFEAARERWRLLCKDAKSVAQGQIRRLEEAMVGGRRWSVAEFRSYLFEHRLLIHLVRRLIWGVYEGDALKATFRVCQDETLADESDETFEFPSEGELVLVHPAEVNLEAWGQVFEDYQILQPFAQLHREVYTAPKEGPDPHLDSLLGRAVSAKAVLGLRSRNWNLEFGDMNLSVIRKHFGPQWVYLEFEPGLEPYDMASSGEQRLACWAVACGDPSDLSSVHYSELVRELRSTFA